MHKDDARRYGMGRRKAGSVITEIICEDCGRVTLGANGQTLCPQHQAEADPRYRMIQRESWLARRNEIEDNSPARIGPEM